MTERSEPVVIVIFGITGDLAKRKVLPALYQLFADKQIAAGTRIVGTSRRSVAPDTIIDNMLAAIDKPDEAIVEQFKDRLEVVQLEPTEQQGFDALRDHLDNIEQKAGQCLHRLYYLSIPPDVYRDIIENLGKSGLNGSCSHGSAESRLLVEKPFGNDLASAQALIDHTARYFTSGQVFRIDHYLAKETAQNIISFRQHNPLFAHLWDNRHVTKVSITAAEQIGIEGRRDFYDNVGALRDLIQSHLMQLLSLTIMTLPQTTDTDDVHKAKLAVLQSLRPVDPRYAVRGQYDTYRNEVGADSDTETYASVVLFSDHLSWEGVPLRLTTGKALKLKRTSITVDFGNDDINRLQFRIQPDEGITMTMQVKKPGMATTVETTSMNFHYDSAFQNDRTPDAYERVLVDALRGDHLLFATDEEVLASWKILQPLLDAWSHDADDLAVYKSGSDGPDTEHLELRRT